MYSMWLYERFIHHYLSNKKIRFGRHRSKVNSEAWEELVARMFGFEMGTFMAQKVRNILWLWLMTAHDQAFVLNNLAYSSLWAQFGWFFFPFSLFSVRACVSYRIIVCIEAFCYSSHWCAPRFCFCFSLVRVPSFLITKSQIICTLII